MQMETTAEFPDVTGTARELPIARIRPVHAYEKTAAYALYAPAIWMLRGLLNRYPKSMHPRLPEHLEAVAEGRPYVVILDLKNHDWSRSHIMCRLYDAAVGKAVGGDVGSLFQRSHYPSQVGGPAYNGGSGFVRGQDNPLAERIRRYFFLVSGTPTVSPEGKDSGQDYLDDLLMLLGMTEEPSDFESILEWKYNPGLARIHGDIAAIILGDNIAVGFSSRESAEAFKALILLDCHSVFRGGLSSSLAGRNAVAGPGNMVCVERPYTQEELDSPPTKVHFISKLDSLMHHQTWDERHRINSEGYFSIRDAYADHPGTDDGIRVLENGTRPAFNSTFSALLRPMYKQTVRDDVRAQMARHEDVIRWMWPIDALYPEEREALHVITMPAEAVLNMVPNLLRDRWALDPASARAAAWAERNQRAEGLRTKRGVL